MMAPSSRRNTMPVMEDSRQTDAERRRLRQAQRSLQKSIVDNGEALENPDDEIFGKIRDKNNDLFQKVFYTREAVLDGENLDMIASHAAKQIDALVQVPRYDALRFSQKLRNKCTTKRGGSGAYFDWAALGRETGTCYNAIPSRVVFLAGPLEAGFEPKARKPRAKRPMQAESEDEQEEERPEEVKNHETNADQLSAVERNIAVLRKTLKNKTKASFKATIEHVQQLPEDQQPAAVKKAKESGYEVDAVQYMFDPKSFTQTVENMFHYSFLVKKGEAKICTRNGCPRVAFVPERERTNAPPARQCIVSLDMKKWRDLCKAHKVEKCDIPHRTGTRQVNHLKRRRVVDEEEDPASP